MAARDEGFRAFAAAHEALLLAYRGQAWGEAETLLHTHAAAAQGHGLGRLYDLYRERVARYRAIPPGADWDGVYEATEK